MSHVYRLTNRLQHYAWGSATAIPDLLGVEPDGAPVAEMWLGAHLSAPSGCSVPGDGPGGSAVPLSELLRGEPDRLLGRAVVDEYGPRLPYLLKVLAADRPLSLQVHPRPHVARAGFTRENTAGIALDAAERNYKDDQHKPEMLVALTPFEGLSGFRRPRRTLQLLEGLDGEVVARMRDALRAQPDARGVRAAFEVALAARSVDCRADIERTMASVREVIAEGVVSSRGHRTALALAEHYPGDPGALVSLMLNRFSLQPGEAVYLGAGEVHAYLSGVGIELMASSDNVLRAGLTTKRVDVEALLSCASYVPRAPEHPVQRPAGGGLTAYRVPAPEFALLTGTVQGVALVAHTGPRILLCLDGSAEVHGAQGVLCRVSRGESVFVAHDAGHVTLRGDAAVAVAYVP